MSQSLSELLKDATKTNHQQLEKIVVKKLKLISNDEEYIQFLQAFYSYFGALEDKIDQLIPTGLEHDFQRRKTERLADDIKIFGGIVPEKVADTELPEIKNSLQAYGALYVIEGSTLGGRVIAKMLHKQLDTDQQEGFSFFTGYGELTESRWATFKELLNRQPANQNENEQILAAADRTFAKFKSWMEKCYAMA